MLGRGSYGLVRSVEVGAWKQAKQEGLEETMMNEIAMLKSLRHPRIIQILSVTGPTEPYGFTMIQGQMDLREYLRRRRMSLEKIQELTQNLFEGVAYLHQRGILHRDLKPANVILTENGWVLIDFGMAIPGPTRGLPAYSPGYLPPEVLADLPYDCSADVWALGCLLYEVHTRRPLFPSLCNSSWLHLQKQMLHTLAAWEEGPGVEPFAGLPLEIRSMVRGCPADRPRVVDLLGQPAYLPYSPLQALRCRTRITVGLDWSLTPVWDYQAIVQFFWQSLTTEHYFHVLEVWSRYLQRRNPQADNPDLWVAAKCLLHLLDSRTEPVPEEEMFAMLTVLDHQIYPASCYDYLVATEEEGALSSSVATGLSSSFVLLPTLVQLSCFPDYLDYLPEELVLIAAHLLSLPGAVSLRIIEGVHRFQRLLTSA